MASDKPVTASETSEPIPVKVLTPQAQRALAEAAERRAQSDAAEQVRLKAIEDGGPAGLEPTRYGDWERKGIVTDF
ncbi:DUF1674 domain-containing protein [Asticcacaulis machinosus]|uniref:DUF1674 domain-containing protein n=1 Tax=Asticcacaulis machinosus TaxID=2984211 RepID=A0ABT5HKQ1_9CAUL|nr:DUF1674 domain-containing protein [Asticcacaulis machinosus]MDC7676821.1 DUF1674 domain-containing protein [Asticcacaulis machinosus]